MMLPKLHLAALMLGAAIVAVGASLGLPSQSAPCLTATLPLPIFVAAVFTHVPMWVFAFATVLVFIAWAYPYSAQSETSKRSILGGAFCGVLSGIYYLYGYAGAGCYQSESYFWSAAITGTALYTLAMVLLLLARKRHNPALRMVATALLFGWLSWLAFPYMGELP